MTVYRDKLGNRYAIVELPYRKEVTIMKQKPGQRSWHVFNRAGKWYADKSEAEAALAEKARKKKWEEETE